MQKFFSSNNHEKRVPKEKIIYERLIKETIYKEFSEFSSRRNQLRKLFIKNNKSLKEHSLNLFLELKKTNTDANMTKSNYNTITKKSSNCIIDDYDMDDDEFVPPDENDIFIMETFLEVNYSNFITLDDDVCVPKGVFCYPIKENFCPEDELEMKFMIKIDDYSLYEKMVDNSKESLELMFLDYPKNRGLKEKIDNEFFILWIFIRVLIKQSEENIHINETIFDIISGLGKIIKKKKGIIKKILSRRLKALLLKSRDRINTQKSSIGKYRELYCQICFSYKCRVHFIKTLTMDQNKLVQANEKKISGNIEIKFQVLEHSHGENFICNKDSCRIKANSIISNLEKLTPSEVEHYFYNSFAKIYNIYDLYLIICLFSSKICSNSCFINEYIFNNKYRCQDINFIEYIYFKGYQSVIEQYLKMNKNDKVFPIISNEKLQIQELQVHEKGNMKKILYGKKNKMQYAFIPCSHNKPCSKQNCECIKLRGYCEKFCSCRNFCAFLFKGCSCSNGCIDSWEKDENCICSIEQRECDPDTCSCLDIKMFTKTKDIVDKIGNLQQKKSCQNMSINFELFKKTTLSKSLVCDYFGLFALEDIEENQLICDYKGEILSRDESERRNFFINKLGLNYLFELCDSDVDAYRMGNNMRYVNHSSYGYENCYARTKYVRGTYKIALFALRKINKGEELYFDYNIKQKLNWLSKYKRNYDYLNK